MDVDKYSLTSSDFYDPLVSCPGGKPHSKPKVKKTDMPHVPKVKQVEVVEAPATPAPEPVLTAPTQENPAQPAHTASIEQPVQEFSAFKGADTSDNKQNYCQDDVDDKILYLRKKWVENEISYNLVMLGLKMVDNWIEESSMD